MFAAFTLYKVCILGYHKRKRDINKFSHKFTIHLQSIDFVMRFGGYDKKKHYNNEE